MFQQEVEELFFLQTGAFIVTSSWWEVIGCLQIREPTVFYSDLPFAQQIVPGCAFQDCTST